MTTKVLLVGESWVSAATHYKGFDQFGSVTFHLGAEPLVAALRDSPFELTYMPSHIAAEQFSFDRAELDKYRAVILSDIGANTLLLPQAVWMHGRTAPNRLKLLRDWTFGGGGLVMVGGYLSFQGIDGRARWRRTPVEDALPVTCLPYDDRIEAPEGFRADVVGPHDHPILSGLGTDWPILLGANEIVARDRPDVEVLARLPAEQGGHPLLVAGEFGAGRSVAWASDIGPHWLPDSFVAWDGYARLWRNMLAWGGTVTADLAPTHVGSGKVMTVLGPVAADALGITLMHEHLLNDCRCWWNKPKDSRRSLLACEPVNAGILGELRMDPFVNLDNCRLDDERLAVAELMPAVELGCRTLVDPTCRGIGRDARALARIAQASGLNIVMGGGYYLQASHPPELAGMGVEAVADAILRDAHEGVDDTGIRIGLIGEIGVSADFTPAEEKSLRGAARAACRSGLPLMVHLPGWERLAHRVLDITEAEGAEPAHTVLCHMNPSFADVGYQMALARRGVFIEYDMIGMDFFYADQGVQCPSDEDNARAIAALVDAGFVERILLSQDVFLKMMLTRYGGFGYAYLLRHFVPRLRRHGVSDAVVQTMLETNPRRVFWSARS